MIKHLKPHVIRCLAEVEIGDNCPNISTRNYMKSHREVIVKHLRSLKPVR